MSADKDDYGPAGTVTGNMAANMVWGALVALVKSDGGTVPADVRPDLYRLVWNEAEAMYAIGAAVAAVKYDRVTAALRHLRALHKPV